MKSIILRQIVIYTVGCSSTLDITIKISNPHQINSKVTFDNEIPKNKKFKKGGAPYDWERLSKISNADK